jgi:hypothetical protein
MKNWRTVTTKTDSGISIYEYIGWIVASVGCGCAIFCLIAVTIVLFTVYFI